MSIQGGADEHMAFFITDVVDDTVNLRGNGSVCEMAELKWDLVILETITLIIGVKLKA